MKNNLRIIYMGTPEFAVPGLEILIKYQYNIVAVLTAPDKPAGRGQKVHISAVKKCALKHNLPILQPKNLKNVDFLEELKSYHADLQIVVAFRMLPEVVWNMPTLGTFNLHASLLPQYRGAAPINWAIINGETETGLTTFFLKHEIDTGDVIKQVKEPIGMDDNVGMLYNRLMKKGAKLILETVQSIERNDYVLAPQIGELPLRKAPKIFKEMCEINFDQPAEQVRNFIRGLSPYPAAWTSLANKRCKIFQVEIVAHAQEAIPGELDTDLKSFVYIKTATAWLSIKDLQREGKKRMKITEFLRGNVLQ